MADVLYTVDFESYLILNNNSSVYAYTDDLTQVVLVYKNTTGDANIIGKSLDY